MAAFGGAYVLMLALGLLTRSGPPGLEATWPAAGVACLWLGWFGSGPRRYLVVASVFGFTAVVELVVRHSGLLATSALAAAYTVQPIVARAAWERLRIDQNVQADDDELVAADVGRRIAR